MPKIFSLGIPVSSLTIACTSKGKYPYISCAFCKAGMAQPSNLAISLSAALSFPVMTVGEDVYGKVTPDEVNKILAKY